MTVARVDKKEGKVTLSLRAEARWFGLAKGDAQITQVLFQKTIKERAEVKYSILNFIAIDSENMLMEAIWKIDVIMIPTAT